MTYEPTEAEIEDVVRTLYPYVLDEPLARRIATHYRPRDAKPVQTCDGSGNVYYRAPGQVVGGNCRGSCPGCRNCPKYATPKSVKCVHEWTSNEHSAYCLRCKKQRYNLDGSYAAGYSAGRDDAARLTVQSVEHVVKLHPETLRALGVFLLFATGHYNVESAAEDTDTVLAKLEETK